jgi:hypothetical protein
MPEARAKANNSHKRINSVPRPEKANFDPGTHIPDAVKISPPIRSTDSEKSGLICEPADAM